LGEAGAGIIVDADEQIRSRDMAATLTCGPSGDRRFVVVWIAASLALSDWMRSQAEPIRDGEARAALRGS
jgi:hypothetical protein